VNVLRYKEETFVRCTRFRCGASEVLPESISFEEVRKALRKLRG